MHNVVRHPTGPNPGTNANLAKEPALFQCLGKVVEQTSYADCLHIAMATIHHAAFLVSGAWSTW